MKHNRSIAIFFTISGLVFAGCSGISDCREDAAKCAAMLNENPAKCAEAFRLTQGQKARKYCERAVDVVGSKKEASAVPGLKAILQVEETSTPNDQHRVAAIKALVKIGDTSAVDGIIKAINLEAGTSSDPFDKNANRTNEYAAQALGKLGDKKGCGILQQLMERSRYDYAVLKAIRSLGRLQCVSAVEAVSKVATKHENKFMRKNAVVALGDIGDLSATDTLVQMMFIEYLGVSFYREASYSLFQLGNGVANKLLETMDGQNEDVNNYFKTKGGLPITAVKAKCGFVLGDLRDKRAVKPLLEAFKTAAEKPDPVLLVYSSAPLGALGDQRAVKVMAKEMLSLDASQRDPIMSALNQLGDRSVVKDMIKGMTAKHFIESCVKLGYASKEACTKDKAAMFGAVKAATDHATNLAGAEHYDAMKAVIDSTEVPEIKKYIEERFVRVAAAKECDQDAACWVKKLTDKSHLIREKAAWELKRKADPSTLGALKKALRDKNTYVRAAAIYAYWSFGDKSAVADIEQQLEDEEGASTFVKVNEDLKRLLVALKR
jgi:HEAT repeat protein